MSDKRIASYSLFEGSDPDDFDQQITDLLADGLVPYGDLKVVVVPGLYQERIPPEIKFYQVMVTYVDDDEKVFDKGQ